MKVEPDGVDENGEAKEKRTVVLSTYGEVYDTAVAVGRSLLHRGLTYK